ncbi:MAG TPA: serine hydrolase [Candidatus Moranbacteria bacterium]|nr:serine hydrolase [Candidatus Moranbacteria bacterium]
MYGDLVDRANFEKNTISLNKILGGEKQKEEINSCQSDVPQSLASRNLFPLDEKKLPNNLIPQRKDNYRDINILAGASVAIDADSGTILEYADGRKQTQIASLTKIMTAILVAEKIENLDESVTITKTALDVDGTTVGCPTSVFCNANRMYVGEKITVRNLLKAMLLNSANDAATALAIHVATTPENFVKLMNAKAKELGLKDTNFCTPSGLEIDGREAECYSSAYDIARIASYSLQYSLIWDIMKIEEEQVYSTNGKYMHQLKNTDMLLREMPNCLGGKTGFTPMAGKSLLTVAADPTREHKIVSVILSDENRWEDMKRLVDWVFANYEWK